MVACKELIGIMWSMITEVLQGHIKNCGKSRYVIARETGIAASVLCRLMKGGCVKDMTIDTLCDYFGLVLTEKENVIERDK